MRPTRKPFHRNPDEIDETPDPDLLYEPFSDWEPPDEDEFHFFNSLLAREVAPDSEYFVSDLVLSTHLVGDRASEKVESEFELEMPRYMERLLEDTTGTGIEDMTENETVVFKFNRKTSKLEPVIQKDADELSNEDAVKNQAQVDQAILKELSS